MPRRATLLALLALLTLATLCAPPRAWAQRPHPALEAAAEPPSPRIGDPVTIRLRLALPRGATVVDRAPRFRDTLPEWVRVTRIDSLARAGDAWTGAVHLVALRTGALRTPPIVVRWRPPSGGAEDSAISPPVAIGVASVLPPVPNQSIKDIKGLERSSLARALRDAGRAAAAAIAIALAISGAVFLLRRRRRAIAPAPAASTAPPMSAYERALARLDEIERRAQWRDADTVDRSYEQVADVLRAYLAEAHALPALERTTPELLALLPDPLAASRRREALRALLREADLVKFARVRPAPDIARDHARRARELLGVWRDALPTAAAAPALDEEAHALR